MQDGNDENNVKFAVPERKLSRIANYQRYVCNIAIFNIQPQDTNIVILPYLLGDESIPHTQIQYIVSLSYKLF
jgi:hypothetical protein